ncbi:MAG: hypothetical protein HUK20_10625 [Fibrobacter sp.]|nr:hypothetical protein [Fibrobacter sp.]
MKIADETARKGENRKKRSVRLIVKILDVRSHFNENLKDVEEKFKLAQKERATDSHSAEEIWRSQVVFLESALDFYVHEVVKYGFLKIFNGDWAETVKSRNFRVRFPLVMEMYKDAENAAQSLSDEIDEINRENCFLGFEHMQTNLKMVGLGVDSKYKEFITELYKRRNQIAHQSDRLPGSAAKLGISESDVKGYIKTVKEIVSSIDEQIKENNKR